VLGTHSLRVTRYSEAMARALGLAADDLALLRTAAALHDVGKVLVPRAVLDKRGPLTREEIAIIRRHPEDGAAMVDGVAPTEVTAMIRFHHERLDGSGYPAGLAGDAIPFGARVIAVADSFDAMTSVRPYREAMSRAAALAELRAQAGVLYDPAVVLCLDEIAGGIDVPAPRDLCEPRVQRPAVGSLLA
jgi:putative nucleotidyltransferase with HDIG domain